MLSRFGRFVMVGGLATALMFALLIVGVEGLGLAPALASALAYVLSALANYALNHRLTFASRQKHRVALPRFGLISGAGLLLNTAIMAAGTALWSGHYLWIQIVATGLVMLWNFAGSQLWTFR